MGPLARQRSHLQASRSRASEGLTPGGAAAAADKPIADAAANADVSEWRGLQGEVDGLVDYAGSLAAKRAQHRWLAERAGLIARLSSLEARAAAQEQKLTGLRGASPTAAASGSPTPAGPAAAAAAHGRELEAQRADAAAWCARFQLERDLRLMSEGAMGDLLGVLDELSLQCEGIGAKFKALDAASGAASAAAKRGAWRLRASDGRGRWQALDIVLVLLVVACAVGAAIVVTRQVLLTRAAAAVASAAVV